MREKYGKRMSKTFAFLRDIPTMKCAVEEIEKDSDLDSFLADNKWKSYYEIGELFKNLDIIRMQEAIGSVILYSAESFGSRGSGFVLSGGDFMDREPIAENTDGRALAISAILDGGIKVTTRKVKEIPDRDLWFERVWADYRALVKE
jgi:hypothetical protein